MSLRLLAPTLLVLHLASLSITVLDLYCTMCDSLCFCSFAGCVHMLGLMVFAYYRSTLSLSLQVFAGIDPRKIPDASFHHLRTEGGYLVSSV